MERVVLVLADGREYYGEGFGAPAPSITELSMAPGSGTDDDLKNVGELVFNTAMSGYTEVLTDPSYTGQIIVMTYPEIGNYGVDTSWAESDPGTARPVKTAGFVVRNLYDGPVSPGRSRLSDYLAVAGIPGVTSIDTRALTLDLRDHGSRNALLVTVGEDRRLTDDERATVRKALAAIPSMEGRSLVDVVGRSTIETVVQGAGPHLALYDCGIKSNIVREFSSLGCTLTMVPATATAAEIEEIGADAFLISNGPGDPAVLEFQVEQTRHLIGRIPVLGICLGHQIIAEARGARTFKMKFGHHGVNHPVRDELGGRVFVTSQNHGFAVEEESLPEGMRVWFRNANDGSVEGIIDEENRIRTTQFHPESAPGPQDSRWIFESFLEAIPGYVGKEN